MKINSNPYLTILTIVFGLSIINYFVNSSFILYSNLILLGIGVLSFKLSKLIEKIWFYLSFLLSQIIPNVLLTLVFFLILTPIALLSKIATVKSEFITVNNKNSFFTNRKGIFKKESFKNAW